MLVENINTLHTNNFHFIRLNLENEFINHQIRKVDCAPGSLFDYLVPNEGRPEKIKKHLDLAQTGIHISTGTERSLFHLLCAEEDKCLGLVIRDINPRVKAYMDFNIALIRISDTREEYVKLSSTIHDPIHRIQTIESIIERDPDLPLIIKQYYLAHARKFGEIYLKADQSWRTNPLFDRVNYCRNDSQFYKIKFFAMAGNIITTVGKINDLIFLFCRNIAVVDTSNICDYSMINLNYNENSQPRVIWTNLESTTGEETYARTKFFSYKHTSLDQNECNKLEILIQKICWTLNIKEFSRWFNKKIMDSSISDIFFRDVGAFYTPNTLKYLEQFVEDNILQVNNLSFYMPDPQKLKSLNYLTEKELFKIASSDEIKRFVPFLIKYWHVFTSKVNLAFCNIEEWKNEFERCFQGPQDDLEFFLNRLRNEGILDNFITSFGETRLSEIKDVQQKSYQQLTNKRFKGF
ncbi:MAG TPA: hypothetical protein VGP47_04670 [Parachlamydiaceae bacterium]|nr:hypothetical protein [Parachlamydiaceae bacterium]